MILWGVLVFAGNIANFVWPRYGGGTASTQWALWGQSGSTCFKFPEPPDAASISG